MTGGTMRIAYLINSLEGGGAAAPVPAIVGVMAAQGADVHVFALSRRDGRAIPGFDAAGLSWSVAPAGKKDHLQAASWVLAELRRFRPTCIWTSLTQATVIGQAAGALLRVPVVSWQHNAFLKPANLAILRLTRSLTSLWVGDSQSISDLTKTRLGLAADRITTWPLFAADPHAPQASAWRRGEVFRLGSLGRLHSNKGYDLLIEALARLEAAGRDDLPRFEVVLGGEGQERARLEALIAARGLRCLRLAGFQRDPKAFLASLHGYLQPSRTEGLGIAAHEAMQAALPVVVANVGELPHTVRHGKEGYVVDPYDVDAVAKAIADLLMDPAGGREMGLAARRRVLDRFDRARFNSAGAVAMTRLAAIVDVHRQKRRSGDRPAPSAGSYDPSPPARS